MPFQADGSWKPNKKQAEFLSLPTSIFEAFYGGGAGSGKSEVLLAYPLIHRWHENPKFKQVFMRRTFPELRNEIVPRSEILYKPFGAKLNRSEMVWTFPSGARVFLGHCENESDVSKYDSMEINLYTPDELTSFIEYIYLYVGYTRVRTSDKTLPAIIRAAGMPGGVGHSFVKKRFVDPAPQGGKIIVGKGGNKRIFIFATQADNPYIDPQYKNKLEGLPEAEKQAKLYGSFDAYLGQVFEEFRDRRYPDEPDNALHVIDPFEIPEWWPKIVVGDWGFAAMTWIGYAAISPDRRVYIYREQWWRKTKIEEWAPFVREYVAAENPRRVIFCKSAGQDRGQEHTIQQQIESALERPIDLTSNNPGSRIATKSLIHEYLRWKPRHITPQDPKVYSQERAEWLLRNRNISEYNSYIDSFKVADQETNLPKLRIFNNCPILIEAIKACVYDKPKEGKAAEDIAEFDGDDPIDGLRYIVDAADQYFNESVDEYNKLQSREALLQKLNQNQDWTMFYRNMARIESEDSISPVRRYARR